LPRQNGLLQLVVGRLSDKSSQVRKNAIQLIIAMLQANPLAAQVCWLLFLNYFFSEAKASVAGASYKLGLLD